VSLGEASRPLAHRLDEAEAALKRALEIDEAYDLARQNIDMLAEVCRTGQPPAGFTINELMAGQGAKTTLTLIKAKEPSER
jgi:hypothetical protein